MAKSDGRYDDNNAVPEGLEQVHNVMAMHYGHDPENGVWRRVALAPDGKAQVSGITVVPQDLSKIDVRYCLNGASSDLAVNGNSTPVVFTYDADPTDDIDIQEIKFIASTDDMKVQGDKFLKENDLNNGMLIEVTVGGTTTQLANFISTEDIFEFASSGGIFVHSVAKDFVSSTFNVAGAMTLVAGSADNVKVTVRDNLNKNSHRLMRMKVVGIKK